MIKSWGFVRNNLKTYLDRYGMPAFYQKFHRATQCDFLKMVRSDSRINSCTFDVLGKVTVKVQLLNHQKNILDINFPQATSVFRLNGRAIAYAAEYFDNNAFNNIVGIFLVRGQLYKSILQEVSFALLNESHKVSNISDNNFQLLQSAVIDRDMGEAKNFEAILNLLGAPHFNYNIQDYRILYYFGVHGRCISPTSGLSDKDAKVMQLRLVFDAEGRLVSYHIVGHDCGCLRKLLPQAQRFGPQNRNPKYNFIHHGCHTKWYID